MTNLLNAKVYTDAAIHVRRVRLIVTRFLETVANFNGILKSIQIQKIRISTSATPNKAIKKNTQRKTNTLLCLLIGLHRVLNKLPGSPNWI
jgi:hypothetical protein